MTQSGIPITTSHNIIHPCPWGQLFCRSCNLHTKDELAYGNFELFDTVFGKNWEYLTTRWGVWRALVHSEKLIKNSKKQFAYFQKFRQLTFNGSHFNFLILNHGLFCTGRKTLEIPTDSSSRSPKSDFLFPQGPAKPRQMVFLNIQLFQICDTPNGFSRRERGLFEVWKTPKLYAISLLHMPVRTWQYYIGSPTWVLIHLLLKSRAVVPRL